MKGESEHTTLDGASRREAACTSSAVADERPRPTVANGWREEHAGSETRWATKDLVRTTQKMRARNKRGLARVTWAISRLHKDEPRTLL